MSERELEVSGAEVVVAITTELAGKVLKNGESADVFLESVIKRVEEGDIQKVNERDDKTTPREHKVLNALAKKQDINLARLAAWAEIKKYKHIDVVAALVFPQPGKIEKDTKLTDKADFLAKAMRKIAQKQVGQKLTDEEIVKGFDVVADMTSSLLQVALKAINGVGQGVEEPLLEVEDVGEEVVDFEKDKIEPQVSKIKKLAQWISGLNRPRWGDKKVSEKALEDDQQFELESKPPEVKVLNLNTASLNEITNLPGVGPAMADRIIEARPFSEVSGLSHIAGLGPTLLERLIPLVGVKVEDKVDVKVEDVQTVAGEDKLSADKIVELEMGEVVENGKTKRDEVVKNFNEVFKAIGPTAKILKPEEGKMEKVIVVGVIDWQNFPKREKELQDLLDLYEENSDGKQIRKVVFESDLYLSSNINTQQVNVETSITVSGNSRFGEVSAQKGISVCGNAIVERVSAEALIFRENGAVIQDGYLYKKNDINFVSQVLILGDKKRQIKEEKLNLKVEESKLSKYEVEDVREGETKLQLDKGKAFKIERGDEIVWLIPGKEDSWDVRRSGQESQIMDVDSLGDVLREFGLTVEVGEKVKEIKKDKPVKEIELEFGGGIYSGKRPVDLTLYSDWQEFRNRVIVAQVKDGYGQGKGLRSILELDRTNIEINIDNPKSSGMASNILMRRELEFINKIDNLQDYLLYVNYGLDKNIFQQKYRDLMGFFKQTGWSDVNDLLSVEKAWERADKEIGQKIELELFDNAGNEKQGLYRSLLKVETVDNQVQISQGSLLIGEFGKQIGNFSLSTSNANICQFSRRGNKVIVGLTSNSLIYRNKAEVGVFIDLKSSQLKENFSQLKEELQTKLELVWGGEVEVRSEADSLFIIRDGRAFKFFTSPKINLRLAWDREKSTKKVVDNTGISQELFNDMLQITEVLVEMGLGKKVEDVETKRKEVVDDFNEVFKSLGVKATVLENGTIEVSGEIEGTFFTKDLKCINALQEVLDLSEVDEGDNVQKVILKHSVSCWRNLKVSKGVVFKRNLFLYKESVFDGGIVNDTLHANENMWFVDGTVGGAVHLGADSNAVIIEDEGKNDVEFGNSDKPALIKGNKLYIGNPNIIDIYGWILRDSRLVKDNIGDGKAFLEYDLQEVEVKEGQTVLKIGDDFVLVTKGDKKALLILQKDGNWDVRIMGGGREVVSKEDLKTALKEFDLTVEVGELF